MVLNGRLRYCRMFVFHSNACWPLCAYPIFLKQKSCKCILNCTDTFLFSLIGIEHVSFLNCMYFDIMKIFSFFFLVLLPLFFSLSRTNTSTACRWFGVPSPHYRPFSVDGRPSRCRSGEHCFVKRTESSALPRRRQSSPADPSKVVVSRPNSEKLLLSVVLLEDNFKVWMTWCVLPLRIAQPWLLGLIGQIPSIYTYFMPLVIKSI